MSIRSFRKIGGDETVDLLEYVRSILEKTPETKIYVGCDSQSYANKTIYVITVVFRYDKRGAHVIYKREVIPKVKDLWTKLWGELQRSIDIAGYLRIEGGINIHQIDLDYNNNQLGGGQNIWTFKLSADYSFSKNLTAILYYDHSFSKAVISTSYTYLPAFSPTV